MSAPTGIGLLAQWAALLRKDARGVARDPFLLWLSLYALLLAGLLRLAASLVPLEGARLLAAPIALLLASMFVGLVFGFVLIEERETRTWLLLRVLPLPERSLFVYLAGVGTALALLVSLGCALVYGLPVLHPGRFAVLALANAALTPAVMLGLGAAAANKIEGLALAKIASTASFAPALVWVVPAPWQALLAWDPWYWLYLGLLRGFADDAALAALLPHWPAWPGACYALAPLALAAAGAGVAARHYRRGV